MDTLTLAEVQKRLKLSRSALLRRRQKGLPPRAVKIGNEIRYPLDEFEAWFAGLKDDVGRAADNSGQHPVSSAPASEPGESESRERLDRPAAYPDQATA